MVRVAVVAVVAGAVVVALSGLLVSCCLLPPTGRRDGPGEEGMLTWLLVPLLLYEYPLPDMVTDCFWFVEGGSWFWESWWLENEESCWMGSVGGMSGEGELRVEGRRGR